MHALHLPKDATPETVDAALREHGYAIIDDLAPVELMDRIEAEMGAFVDATPFGSDAFSGRKTKRTGALIARSPAARDLIMNPLVLGATKLFLGHATKVRLHLTQIISVHPGAEAQALHKDELAWDFFPFPADYDVQCNVLWAFTDYTEDMGATRVVPGSHRGERDDYSPEESIASSMRRGSALIYTGKVFHGAGANRSDKVRQAINVTYAVGWVRQEENQYLSTPLETARGLSDDLLRLMGYDYGCFAMGYVGDAEHPLRVLRPEMPHVVMSTKEMERQADLGGDAARFSSVGEQADG